MAFHHHNSNSGGNHHNNHHNGSANKQGEILSKSDFQASIELMHDRADYAIVNSIGSKISVTTKDLKVISGILRTIKDGPDGILDLLIQFPTISGNVGSKSPFTDYDKSQAKPFNDELVTIKFDDIFKFELADVKFDSKSNNKSAFQTDTSISKPLKNSTSASNKQSKDNHERVLVQWTPDENDNISNPSLNADLNSNENWDQFATNKTKFNVTSTFNEDLYTTKLNTKGTDFEKRKIEADKIAREIESQKSSNIHLAEERNQDVDDSNVDEEDKYSGVQRPNVEVQKNSEDSKKLMNLLTSKIDSKQQQPQQQPQHQTARVDEIADAKQPESINEVKNSTDNTPTHAAAVNDSPAINSPDLKINSAPVSNTVSASSSKPVSKKNSPMLSSDSIKTKPKPKPDFSSFNFNSNAFTPSNDKKSKFQQQKTNQQSQRVLNQRTPNYNNYNNLNHPQNAQQFHPPTYSPQQQFLPPQQQHHQSPQNYYQQHPMQYAPHPIQAPHIPQQSNPLPLHNQHAHNAPPQFQHQIPQLPHQQKQNVNQTPKFFVDGKEPKSSPPKSVLANKFNFLKSAKEEFLNKNSSKQEIHIIPIEKSFAVASWNVNIKSFTEYFQKDLPVEIIQPNYSQSMNSRNMYPMVAMPMVSQFYSYPANVAFSPAPNVGGGGGGVGW